ncbi:ABC transporter permease [Curvivirga sp.]|uniref:ABC transporter permease n=1 Tax=Curvivirga sp. TaxID=2856848 RepID=UPI003B5B531C
MHLLGFITVLLGISLITFALYYFSPGDKAEAIARATYEGEIAFSNEVIQGIIIKHGLDKPFFDQYLAWLLKTLSGDFGNSWVSNAPAIDIFMENVGGTLELSAYSLMLGLFIAFLLSILCYIYPGSVIDKAAIAISSIGAAIPNFWLALILIFVFSVSLNWLPSYGSDSFSHQILPVITLSFWVISSQTRLLRSFFLEAKQAPFISTLRMRGVSEVEIFLKHVIPHSTSSALTMIALDLAHLLEGAIIIEIIFVRGGLGSLLIYSVGARDYPMLILLTLFSAIVYLLTNIFVEQVQSLLDPRKRVALLKNKKIKVSSLIPSKN